MQIVRTVADLRKATAPWRMKGETIALVPTMGALHAGHLALVEKAAGAAGRTVVSIFVNPAQFGPAEDLDRYPRDEEADLQRLRDNRVDLVWAPSVAEMYPEHFSTAITPGSAAQGLETTFRPHFFQGVATVVMKLLQQVRPDFALFGEKDYQQLCVVRQLVRDLDVAAEILAVRTMREPDGLALSSRNAYLSPAEREIAPRLYQAITDLAAAARTGNLDALTKDAVDKLVNHGFRAVDYIEVRDAETLGAFDPGSGRGGRVLAAAWLGTTRLIDNVPVPD